MLLGVRLHGVQKTCHLWLGVESALRGKAFCQSRIEKLPQHSLGRFILGGLAGSLHRLFSLGRRVIHGASIASCFRQRTSPHRPHRKLRSPRAETPPVPLVARSFPWANSDRIRYQSRRSCHPPLAPAPLHPLSHLPPGSHDLSSVAVLQSPTYRRRGQRSHTTWRHAA